MTREVGGTVGARELVPTSRMPYQRATAAVSLRCACAPWNRLFMAPVPVAQALADRWRAEVTTARLLGDQQADYPTCALSPLPLICHHPGVSLPRVARRRLPLP